MDVARIESNSFALVRQPFKVEEVIFDIIKDYQRNPISKSTRFIYKVQDNLIVIGDRNKKSQVISNLVDNALKFSDYHDSISLKAEGKVVNTINEGKIRKLLR